MFGITTILASAWRTCKAGKRPSGFGRKSLVRRAIQCDHMSHLAPPLWSPIKDSLQRIASGPKGVQPTSRPRKIARKPNGWRQWNVRRRSAPFAVPRIVTFKRVDWEQND